MESRSKNLQPLVTYSSCINQALPADTRPYGPARAGVQKQSEGCELVNHVKIRCITQIHIQTNTFICIHTISCMDGHSWCFTHVSIQQTQTPLWAMHYINKHNVITHLKTMWQGIWARAPPSSCFPSSQSSKHTHTKTHFCLNECFRVLIGKKKSAGSHCCACAKACWASGVISARGSSSSTGCLSVAVTAGEWWL